MKKFFISKITNKQYTNKNDFLNELNEHNLTLEEYCDKFLKNVSNKKHIDKTLNENEMFYYKNIRLIKGTYEKLVINKHFKCDLCNNFYAASKPSFVSHIKRHHKIDLYNYFKKINFKEINPKKELCAFCNKNEAVYDIKWNENDKTFEKIYDGYFCWSDECKDNICLEYFGKKYSESKYQFEHIGGNTSFLCKKHKTTPEGLKLIGKSKAAKTPSHWKSNLKGFISKYGIEEGTKRYEKRCKNISYTQKIDWFIDKYGDIEGPKKYFEKLEKISNFHKRNKNITSKGETELYFLIKSIYNDAVLEYPTKDGIVDIFVPSKSTVIEYYGDYWHCNSKYYNDDFYNKNLQMTSKEKHDFDKNKNEKYLKNIKNSKIVVIWESSYKLEKDKEMLLNKFYNFIEQKETIGKILWI